MHREPACPKVAELHDAVLVHQHVIRLHVAVQDAVCMKIVQAKKRLVNDPLRPSLRQFPAHLLRNTANRAVRCELHNNSRNAVILDDEVVHSDDVWMSDFSKNSKLRPKRLNHRHISFIE